jgi:uncharacterized protein
LLLRWILSSAVPSLFAGSFATRPFSLQAMRRLLELAQPLVSESTLEELANLLSGDKFDRYVSLADRQEFFQKFARVAEWVEVTTVVSECRDPRDDHFPDLAIDGSADLILTVDEDLPALMPFRGVAVLAPAAALSNRVIRER